MRLITCFVLEMISWRFVQNINRTNLEIKPQNSRPILFLSFEIHLKSNRLGSLRFILLMKRHYFHSNAFKIVKAAFMSSQDSKFAPALISIFRVNFSTVC